MTFTQDWPHGHVTRDGRKARILATIDNPSFPIVAVIAFKDGERSLQIMPTGMAYPIGASGIDLINAPAPAETDKARRERIAAQAFGKISDEKMCFDSIDVAIRALELADAERDVS